MKCPKPEKCYFQKGYYACEAKNCKTCIITAMKKREKRKEAKNERSARQA